ncbi:MAG: hypothetical protein AW11_03005 [Candidatus Accumulibacter regalis]|uniref:Uncharacterized protein n=1 Tax=Accumulibacter regalis TaxID=522306 RepID=A0A011NTZ6_ACCRE|nr:MAG: hypothetical protein AW11_03005 [Candidatus Accumulibacter regalis]
MKPTSVDGSGLHKASTNIRAAPGTTARHINSRGVFVARAAGSSGR